MTIEDIKELIKIIGGDTYLVGGAVRDMQLGIEPKDRDLCTNVPIEELESKFETHDIGKNKDFGIVVIHWRGEDIEIAQFRSEGSYSDGRHPDEVTFVKTIEEDLARRDFTINAMAYDGENIIDPYGGTEDLIVSTLRFVGDPMKRIEEDGLRVLRAYRFAARFGLKIKNEEVMKGFDLGNISQERITDELRKVASYGPKQLAFFLDKIRINDIFLDIGFDFSDVYPHQDKHHPEGDCRTHTLSCLCNCPVSPDDTYLTYLAVLYHDIGKWYTKALSENGRYIYWGHDQYDFSEIGKRLKLSSGEMKTIQYVINQHMEWRDHKRKKSKVLNMVLNEDYPTLRKVTYADEMSRLYLGDSERHNRISEFYREILETYKNAESLANKIKNHINGNMILEAFPDIQPKDIGRVKGKIVEELINNGFDNVDVLSRIKYYGKACTTQVVLSSAV